jgi:hypothetical protein
MAGTSVSMLSDAQIFDTGGYIRAAFKITSASTVALFRCLRTARFSALIRSRHKTQVANHGIKECVRRPHIVSNYALYHEQDCTTHDGHIRDAEPFAIRGPIFHSKAFQLREFDGLSTTETCRVLGIREPGFKSRILRARRKITHALIGFRVIRRRRLPAIKLPRMQSRSREPLPRLQTSTSHRFHLTTEQP